MSNVVYITVFSWKKNFPGKPNCCAFSKVLQYLKNENVSDITHLSLPSQFYRMKIHNCEKLKR